MAIVLGIESSCDETACGIVRDGRELLANAVISSMDLHAAFGGVVPEIAARSHIESITPVITQALKDAALTWDDIDGIAVTYGAGLGGSLLVGVMTARTLAITKQKPLYAVNHVEGHVYANFLTAAGNLADTSSESPMLSQRSHPTPPSASRSRLVSDESPAAYREWRLGNVSYALPSTPPVFPVLALIVSGGHSQLVLFRDHFDYTLLGQTQDDAIGEAFDKVAKIVGLPYPGGPSVGKKALEGNDHAFSLPKAKMTTVSPALTKLREAIERSKNVGANGAQGAREELQQAVRRSTERVHSSTATQQNGKSSGLSYDFSFSGLKTAVLRQAQALCGKDFTFPSKNLPEALQDAQKADIAAVFQRIAIETVVDKAIAAYEEFSPASVVIAGGVASSLELRRQLEKRLPIPIQYTDPKLCTDNGAMIATLGCYKMMHNQPPADPYSLEIQPNLSM